MKRMTNKQRREARRQESYNRLHGKLKRKCK